LRFREWKRGSPLELHLPESETDIPPNAIFYVPKPDAYGSWNKRGPRIERGLAFEYAAHQEVLYYVPDGNESPPESDLESFPDDSSDSSATSDTRQSIMKDGCLAQISELLEIYGVVPPKTDKKGFEVVHLLPHWFCCKAAHWFPYADHYRNGLWAPTWFNQAWDSYMFALHPTTKRFVIFDTYQTFTPGTAAGRTLSDLLAMHDNRLPINPSVELDHLPPSYYKMAWNFQCAHYCPLNEEKTCPYVAMRIISFGQRLDEASRRVLLLFFPNKQKAPSNKALTVDRVLLTLQAAKIPHKTNSKREALIRLVEENLPLIQERLPVPSTFPAFV